jgi:S1-C subfamily serine protease
VTRTPRPLLAAFLTAFLAFTPIYGMAERPLKSVLPLQFEGRTFCTAFSINEQDGYWATAGHCAHYAHELWVRTSTPSTIARYPAIIVYIDKAYDVAVFQTKAKAVALKLSKKAPEVRDALEVIGHPYGNDNTVTRGILSARHELIYHPSYHTIMPSDVLDITTAGGNSGSPVLKNGKVVGVLWGGYTASPHSLAVPWEALKVAFLPYLPN